MNSSETSTEHELRYWLANEDWYMSQYTRTWLERTPREEAADLLARIAEDAQPEPKNLGSMALTAFATAGFLPTAGAKIDARKAGIRAALILADRSDPRSLPPLLRVFETRALWQNKYQELIETALTRYLREEGARQPEMYPYVAEIRQLAASLWSEGGIAHDIPRSRGNLLLATFHYLSLQSTKEENVPLLGTISDVRLGEGTPHRVEIQKHARTLSALE